MDFGTVPTVWYFLFFYWILELSDSVVFFVFLFDFGTVPTVWYFFVFLLDFGTVPSVWYFLFFYLILELFRQCGIFCSSFYLYIKYKDEFCILYFLLGIRKQSLIVIRKIDLGDIVVVIVW